MYNDAFDICLTNRYPLNMLKVSIRELTHNFSKYLKAIKAGERLVILERNRPVADLVPHNENLTQVGWKREIKRLSLKGEPLSQVIQQERRESE
jgi:antitoxin (DNA-binding transcriptional repressor) of toxin-antitoxin stability system